MSKPRYGWWSYVKNMIHRYPALREQHEAMLHMQTTPAYSAVGGGGDGRGLENTIIRAMSKNEMREYDAVTKAINETEGLLHGQRRLKLVTLVYWQRTHTVEGASWAVHVSSRTGRQWHGDFIRCVAKHFGFLK